MTDRTLSELQWQFDDGVATLILNRPERRNAMTTVMLAELIYALEQCEADPKVRAVVLRGAGKGFCAGDELRGMGSLPDDFAFTPKREVSHVALQSCLREMPKPTIAAIHGFAFGVALDLAMACDFRVAQDDAQLRDQRVIERGMHAVTGCAWFQPRALGVTKAMEFLVLGKAYSGMEAADAAMVTCSAPQAEFESVVSGLAGQLAAAPTKAIGLMKRQIYTGLSLNHGEFMAFAAPLLREVEIKDREEGIRAFLEKRPAKFTGE
jgi:2-(1,2-epoxy-1,2-dihydrophenyl)acetyl-CoA isomerase